MSLIEPEYVKFLQAQHDRKVAVEAETKRKLLAIDLLVFDLGDGKYRARCNCGWGAEGPKVVVKNLRDQHELAHVTGPTVSYNPSPALAALQPQKLLPRIAGVGWRRGDRLLAARDAWLCVHSTSLENFCATCSHEVGQMSEAVNADPRRETGASYEFNDVSQPPHSKPPCEWGCHCDVCMAGHHAAAAARKATPEWRLVDNFSRSICVHGLPFSPANACTACRNAHAELSAIVSGIRWNWDPAYTQPRFRAFVEGSFVKTPWTLGIYVDGSWWLDKDGDTVAHGEAPGSFAAGARELLAVYRARTETAQ